MSTIALGALAAGATGCAENDSSLYVLQMEVRTIENECTVDDDPSGLFLPLGTWDPLVAPVYIGAPLVANGMVARGDEDRLRAESNHVQLYEMELEVVGPNNTALTPSIGDDFSSVIPVAGFVEVGAPTNPGFGVTEAPMLRADQIGDTAGTILVRFLLRGETTGGKDVETGIFDFPIQVIPGGTRALPPGIVDCTSQLEDDVIPCRLGQDEGVAAVDPRLLGQPCL